MDIWDVDSLLLFLIFFIPGFISIKIYDLLVPSERRDFSNAVYEAIGYSCLNYSAMIWLILILYYQNIFETNFYGFIAAVFIMVLITPIIWPIIFYKFATSERFSKHIIHPMKKPWDYVFKKGESYWVIFNVLVDKNIIKLGGIYGTNSFTSSYPAEEQIYIEEVWKLDENGKFEKPIEKSKGMIINGKNILAIELFDKKRRYNVK
jgi:hypothetical protein